MKTLEQLVRELTDREEIKEVTARYAHAIAQGDGAAAVALFTDDAVFTSAFTQNDPPMVLRGRVELEAFYTSIKRNMALPCVHNHVISIAGDTASARSSLEVRIALNGKSMIGSAVYEDRLRREDGRWKFAERRCDFFHFVPIQQGWTSE